jgi:hypothetical protein
MLKFAKFMAKPLGRIIRIVAGAAIIWWGSTMGGGAGYVVMALGTIPVLAGIFDLCMIAPFIGVPFKGKDILALHDAE